MTERATLQLGRLFRDLDGTIVHLRGIRNEICIWTSDLPCSDGALGGATHVNNFRRRFVPVPEARAEAEVETPVWMRTLVASEMPTISA